jgi:hypothetical protein
MSRAGGPVSSELIAQLAVNYNDRHPQRSLNSVRRIVESRITAAIAPFWHPLGFFRIELGSDDAGLRYFLHFWPDKLRSTQDPAWMVHRHVWDLESLVLLGGLEDFEYERIEDAAQAEICGPLYEAHVRPGLSVLERTSDTLSLEHRSADEIAPGRFYRIDIGRFHKTLVPDDSFCCTLVRIGPRLRSLSQVLGDWTGDASVQYDRIPVANAVIINCLGRLIGLGRIGEQVLHVQGAD